MGRKKRERLVKGGEREKEGRLVEGVGRKREVGRRRIWDGEIEDERGLVEEGERREGGVAW